MLGDSCASNHLRKSSTGMINLRPYNSKITIRDGTGLYTTMVGDWPVRFLFKDGSTLILMDVRLAPNIQFTLLSLTKAMLQGWTLGSRGLAIMLSKDDQTVVFDRLIKTATCYVCGVQTQVLQEGDIPIPGLALVAAQSMPMEKFHWLLGHPSYALTRATAERLGFSLMEGAEK